MTALNQPGLRQETLSGSPLREPDEDLVPPNTNMLHHQQQEQQSEQDLSEDSCTSGSKATGRSDEVCFCLPLIRKRQKDMSCMCSTVRQWAAAYCVFTCGHLFPSYTVRIAASRSHASPAALLL